MTDPPQSNKSELNKQLEELDLALQDKVSVSDVEDPSRLERARRVLGLIHRVRHTEKSSVDHTSLAETSLDQETPGGFGESEQQPSISAGALDLKDEAAELHQVGRFEVQKHLGHGGYGIVFLAYDPLLDRDVALKIPKPEAVLTPELRSRFQREAKAAASLSHPSIVPVYESGADGPICFIAYEFIQGITLAQWMSNEFDGQASDPTDAARLMASLADAVHYAHQRGVLHRDLKPSNVMLKPTSSNQREHDSNAEESFENRPSTSLSSNSERYLLGQMLPMITDFGMAKMIGVGDAMPEGDDWTKTGAIVGTPAYMSPEQTQSSHTVDSRSDIYSLGAILYELLTGRAPFVGDSILETLQRVQKAEPVSPRKHNSAVSQDLSAICLRCLEKSPADRYETAHDLQTDLLNFLEGRTVSARPVSQLNKLKKWYQRNPLLAASITTAIAAIAVGLASTTALWLRADHLHGQSELRGTKLAKQKQQLETKTEQLETKTSQLNSAIRDLFLEVAQSEEIKSPAAGELRRGLLDRANRFYESFVAEKPDDLQLQLAWGQTLFELARVHEYLGDPAAALRMIRQAIDEVELDENSLPSQLALITWHGYAASRLGQLGRFDEAEAEIDRAMQLVKSVQLDLKNPHRELTGWDRIRAALMVKEAESFVARKNSHAVLKLTGDALEIFENQNPDPANAFVDDDRFNKALCLWIRSRAHRDLNQHDKTEACLAEAVDILESLAKDEVRVHCSARLKFGQCLYEKGVCHSRKNELETAKKYYRQAVEQLKALPVTLDFQLDLKKEFLRISYSWALAEILSGNFSEAEQQILKNIADLEQLVEEIPQERAQHLDRLGDSFNLLYLTRVRAPEKNHRQAEQAIRRAIECFEQAIAEQPRWLEPLVAVAKARTNLANVLLRQDQLDAAGQEYGKSEEELTELMQTNPNWSQVRSGMCNLLQGQTDLLVKKKDYAQALQRCRAAQSYLPSTAFNHILLDEAWILANLDRIGTAKKCLKTFADKHARRWQDFLAVAHKTIEISRLEGNQVEDDFRQLAVDLLRQGLPKDAASRTDFFKGIEKDPLISELANSIENDK